MPVTARLSKAFYDRLGEQVVNEMVEWFNQVDATYRSDLRELNETNFARFEAKIEIVEGRLTSRMESLVARNSETLKDEISKRLAEQTRFLYLGWALQFAAILGLWLR